MSDLKRTLKDEAETARALLASLQTVLNDDEEARHDAVEGETGLIEAIGAAVDRLAEIDAHETALATMAKDLASRRDRFQNQAEQIRAAVLVAMSTAELKKLELPQATLTRKATPPKAIVTAEADLPSRFFVDQAPKLDKRSLLDALKSGEKIAGAELSNGGETLQLRKS